MKILIACALLCSSSIALASDRFEDEIICIKDLESGNADNGLEVNVQSNPTAWVKRVVVIENGILGPREIGSFQVPLDQPVISTASFFGPNSIATYEAAGLRLSMEVADAKGQIVVGPARAQVELPGYGAMDVVLSCKRIR